MLDSRWFPMAQVLVVCTGNICRSPMAEGFLRGQLRTRTDDGEPITVSSSGTSGWEGSLATPESIAAAAERDADISGHRSRRLARHQVERADLVLGMTTEHRDRAIRLAPAAAARTFTVKELVQLLEALPGSPAEGSGAERLRARVAAADDLRVGGFEGNLYDLDVADPIGLSIDTYRAIAWEIDDLVARLVDGLLGPASVPTPLAAMWKEGE
jgi:protein-tyrosine phosphatase